MALIGPSNTQGAKPHFLENQTWNVVKGCAPEMISRTFKDHNLGGQPGQLATGKLQEVKIANCHHVLCKTL